ncbi:glycosyltransferase family 2 protein [Fistulina hepatica ATCC 64428]|uniref:chitin synthase n=1 Tax=Fistulina hepatica ATCC 64428 TaxID=1128425 RepID=A0A0D7ASY0_9AGAR|nr:glycosyltransferase family 2 protein [Fistulina hepatica ATCC 64428]
MSNRRQTTMTMGGLRPGMAFNDVSDLTLLENISGRDNIIDDTILHTLRERLLADTMYTAIGTCALVAMNPHKYVPSSSDSTMWRYITEYRETGPGITTGLGGDRPQRLPPHVFQQALDAYFHMRRTGQDQSLVFSGETASGKSESRRLAIKSILNAATAVPGKGKKPPKLLTQLPAAQFILETFGNARTLFNANASRFGMYTELQFNERGRLCGVKTLDYYLERARVTVVPSGERNFHIFYYLSAGASPEERAHMHLDDHAGGFRYLGGAQLGNRASGNWRAGVNTGIAYANEDAARFEQLKGALKAVGLSKRHVAQTCQLIAAILHLGNLEFTTDRARNEDTAVVHNVDALNLVAEFLGVSPGGLQDALTYKTKLIKKELCTVFLDPDGASDNRDDLAKTLYSLLFAWLNEHLNQKLCKDDFDTFIGLFELPGPQNLTSRPNSLDQFVVNFANERLQHWIQTRIFETHAQEYEVEGLTAMVPRVPYFDNSECVRLIQNQPGGLIHIMDDQARRAPRKTNQTMIEAFQKRWGSHPSLKVDSEGTGGFKGAGATFTVTHFAGPVTYAVEGFLERNLDAMNPDFVSLLRGADDITGANATGSGNPFIKSLFSNKAIATQVHPRDEDTIVGAQQNVKPMRRPSTRHALSTRRANGVQRRVAQKDGIEEEEVEVEAAALGPGKMSCIAGEFRVAMDTLFTALDETQAWFVFCINPNDSQLPNQVEGRSVKSQIRSLGLPEIAKQNRVVYEVSMTLEEFCERYKEDLMAAGIAPIPGSEATTIDQASSEFSLGDIDMFLGKHKVFLSQYAFHKFENNLRIRDGDEQKRSLREMEAAGGLDIGADPYAPYTPPGATDQYGDATSPWNEDFNQSSQEVPLVANASPFHRAGLYDDDYEENRSEEFDGRSRATSQRDDSMSNYGSESYAPSRNMFGGAADKKALLEKDAPLAGEIQEGETTEVVKETSARRRWVALCWVLTWWVPSFMLSCLGRMKRPDIRQAWREKLALNLIIWFICGVTIFVITVLGDVLCPTEHVYSTGELTSHSYSDEPDSTYTSIRGEVFDLTTLAAVHYRAVPVVATKTILDTYGGESSDDIFPVQVSALCNGVTGSVSPWVTLNTKNVTDSNAQYHDFRAFTNDSRPDWYYESMVMMRYEARVGFLGYTPSEIKSKASSGDSVAIYDGHIYDVTDYIKYPPGIQVPDGYQAPDDVDTAFMSSAVIDVFKVNAGTDVTKILDNLDIDSDVLERQKVCLRNLYLIGKVDNSGSARCQFSKYFLLALSILMVSIIGFKFLASVNFGSVRAPEDHDKFVICQVPCYTEGEASLRRTIDSLAQMKYDDKRKLIVVICDGMIVGSGNDRPTPRIVLDILGADPNLDPEPMSFLSLGEGSKQHNMGKVYSGLYECAGHVVPYLVLVKVGKPAERSRPGNRGKRDSQLLLMRFFNRVHFDSPMTPFELEMYHQIKNVIGVNPTFYEYIFTIDADTTVDVYSINRLVSAMVHDKKLLGVCGETELSNAKQSIITMMQVYEYFISHHMAKAFESLFGSVTCLPGCFSLYRLRTPDTHKPLLVSSQLVQDYSENRVDTLHMKNLLHLGEDRYLTTLLLRHFPLFKTQFVRDAHAYTVAPDDWKVLLSQRRRWINSTVHNLGELVFLEQLCGFCCFSMRFIVMIDLLSTIVMPVTVVYIVYLVYLVAVDGDTIPTTSLIMICAIYGLQALVFIMRRKWDMIGWMVFYICAIPVFSFALPLYSFWKMDDFSWGATRLVLGEAGKKIVVHDEGKFDPKCIPLKSWSDYENELWDKESNHSIGSWVPPAKMKNDGYAESMTASIYGRETFYEPAQSKSYSPAHSPLGGVNAGMMPPGYFSGRNTPQSQIGMPMMMTGMQPMSPIHTGMQSPMHTGGIIQPSPSRPTTHYLDIPLPGTSSPEEGMLTDAEIENAVRDVLSTADLNSVTKRGVRGQLEERFGMDLSSRKAAINAAIDRVLLAHS